MLLVLLIIFMSEKRLDSANRKRFYGAIFTCILCLLLDIASTVLIKLYRDGLVHELAAIFARKIYLISIAQQVYQGFLYAAGTYFAAKRHFPMRAAFSALYMVGAILILALPMEFATGKSSTTFVGPAIIVSSAVIATYIGFSIGMAFLKSEYIRIRRMTILLWQSGWIITFTVQATTNAVPLVGFAAAFGIVIIYMELESPHIYLDRTTGLFNSNAFLTYVSDMYAYKKSFASVTYTLHYPMQDADYSVTTKTIAQIADILNEDKEGLAFKNDDETITVIYKSAEKAFRSHRLLLTKVNLLVKTPIEISSVYLPDSLMLSNEIECFHLLHYLRGEYPNEEFIRVTESIVKESKEMEEVNDMVEKAIRENRVVVYYQPIYNLEKKKFLSAEALVRIKGKDGELIYPGTFIPAAERSGIIVDLSEVIFEKVCQFLSRGEAIALGIEYIEVNLSVAEFDADNPSTSIIRKLNRYGLDGKYINFEITETAESETKTMILKNMNALLEKGITFSLDDFGTGRSNLDYFVEMPVSVIKFDHTFTKSYFESEKARRMLESISKMMSGMNLSLVAEGIETKEQFEEISKLGITSIQGFYFSQAIDEDSFLQFLREHNR